MHEAIQWLCMGVSVFWSLVGYWGPKKMRIEAWLAAIFYLLLAKF